MPKKRKKSKEKKERYETDKLLRWNLCQKIAKLLYHSDFSFEDLEVHYSDIIDNSIKQCNE